MWQVRGFCARVGLLTYYDDDDALREGYAEEDVSEEAVIYPSRVIDNDTDADLIKGVEEVVPSMKTSYSVLLRNASSDPDGEKIDDDYELDATVFLEGDEPSRTEWCAKHGLVVDSTTTTEDVREMVDQGNVNEITRRRRRALYRRRPKKKAPLSRRRLLRDIPQGVKVDETRPSSVLGRGRGSRCRKNSGGGGAFGRFAVVRREALLAGREPVRRAPSPPATAAPVSEDVPPGLSASTAEAAEAEEAPSAKRPLSDDDGDAAPAKKAR